MSQQQMFNEGSAERSSYEGYREQPLPPYGDMRSSSEYAPPLMQPAQAKIQPQRSKDNPVWARVAVAIASLIFLIPLTAISLGTVGLPALVLLCTTVVIINVAFNWKH